MNFAHFCEFWCFSLGKQARFTYRTFVPEWPCEKFMNRPFFGLVCRGHFARGVTAPSKQLPRPNRQGRKKQHKHKLFGPDFQRTFLTLTPERPGVKKFLPTTGAAGKRTFGRGRPRFSARTSMTRRVVEKLCTKKVCVDFLAPKSSFVSLPCSSQGVRQLRTFQGSCELLNCSAGLSKVQGMRCFRPKGTQENN